MERNEFLTTGWPLAKPFLLKAQGLDAQAQIDQGGKANLDHQEEHVPEVKKKFKLLL
jgi:hypothetical protein